MVSNLLRQLDLEKTPKYAINKLGLLNSQRQNNFWLYRRNDNTAFTALSVLKILDGISHLMASEDFEYFTHLKAEWKDYFEDFKNKKDCLSLNFWKNKPKSHFPNGFIFRHFKHFKLPDDIDDTALYYLNYGLAPEQNEKLLAKLLIHSARGKNILKPTSPQVYNTWFGENMPLETDFCAVCNMLLLRLKSGNALSEIDLGSIKYINDIITKETYLTDTFWVSRHYASIPLIVYHFSRLVFETNTSLFDQAKLSIVRKIPDLIAVEELSTNKLLLAISALKLNIAEKNLSLHFDEALLKKEPFYPFIGAPLAPFGLKIAKKTIFLIYWRCNAHIQALLFEYSLLITQKSKIL